MPYNCVVCGYQGERKKWVCGEENELSKENETYIAIHR